MGRGTFGPEGLIQIAFTLVGVNGHGDSSGHAEVQGVALDPRRLAPGLVGAAVLRHPRAAAAVMAAAMQATSDYAQALEQQGQATLTNGWADIVAGQAAPAWTYAAGRLMQILAPRGDSGAPVETSEISAGSALIILITEAP